MALGASTLPSCCAPNLILLPARSAQKAVVILETLVEWYNGQSNWAIEGFNVPTGGGKRSFGIRVANDACSGGFKSHHIAVINTITSNSMQGFGFNDCGILGGSATIGADYVATVGMIVQNSNRNGDFQGGICVGAIDFVGLTNWDTVAGTHAFMHNNYGMNNQVSGLRQPI